MRCVILAVAVQLAAATSVFAKEPAAPASYRATALGFADACVSTSQESALLTAVAPILVDAALDLVRGWITAAAEDRTTPPITGVAPYDLDLNAPPQCIFLASGAFLSSGQAGAAGPFTRSESERLHAANFDFASPPDFFFEGRLRWSSAGNAVSIQPLSVYIGDPQLSGSAPRTITLTLSLRGMTGEASSTTLSLVDVPVGVLSRYSAESPQRSGMMTFTANSQADRPTPIQLEAGYSEFRRGSDAARFVGRIYDAARTTARQDAMAAIDPSARRAAVAQGQQASIAADNAAASAFAGACTAIENASTARGAGTLGAISSARGLQIDADVKAQSAGLPVYFGAALVLDRPTPANVATNRERMAHSLQACAVAG
jgi:hypothetical protein